MSAVQVPPAAAADVTAPTGVVPRVSSWLADAGGWVAGLFAVGRWWEALDSSRSREVSSGPATPVDLDVPKVVHATGAELSWRPYVDPSSAADDDLMEYQLHRSYQPNLVPSAATLVAPLPPGMTSYTDTTAQPADAGAAQGRPVFYTVMVVRKDGQKAPSPEVGVALPQVGYTTRTVQAQALVADTTLSACQPVTVENRTELVAGFQDLGRNSNYVSDTSAIPQNATVTDMCQTSGEGVSWFSSENAGSGLQVTYTDPTLTYYAPATPSRLQVGETASAPVTITNTTAQMWPATSTRLGYWWKRPDGTDVTTAGSQVLTALPADLAPGQTVTVNATITAPALSMAENKAEAFTLAWDIYDAAANNWKSSTSQLPQLPQQIGIEDPTSNLLGVEDFYSYTGTATGAGSDAMVNNYAGNVVWSYDAFNHPSRGPDTSVTMTYNSLDTSRSAMGFGWSLHTSTLQRLGSRLSFSPPGQTWPSQVRLIDSDGTTSVFTLDTHGLDRAACTPGSCDYIHPRGVHLYLQQTGSTDPMRTWVFTAPDRTKFFFDGEGYQSAIVDNNDNTLSFVYEQRKSNNVPTKFLQYVVDAGGRHTLELDWWTKGENYTYITDAGLEAPGTNLTNPFIIDQLQSITDIAGRKITFTYTVKGLMAKMVDGAGDAQAKTFRFDYDATQGNNNVKLLTVTDPRANTTSLSYYTAPVDPQNLWKLRDLTNRIGGVTHFDYVDPDGPTQATMHTTVTDAEGHATRYLLDALGRPERVTDAKNQTTIYGYDGDHNLTRLEEPPAYPDADGAVSTWTYDTATGYPRTFTTAAANLNDWPATEYLYLTSLNGNVADLVTKTSPERHGWFYTYDERGNLASVTDPDGTASPEEGDYTTRFGYDDLGQLTSRVDANGNTTTLRDYNATGQPETIIDAYGNATQLGYDERGNLLTITDPLQHSRSRSYDLFKRLLTTTEQKDAAAGNVITTPAPVYDANDNVTTFTAANGAVSTSSYDADDRVTSILEPRDGPDGPERKTTFTYDKVSNLRTVTEPNGNQTPTAGDYTTTYGYDEIYQLLRVTDAAGYTTDYHYDGAGNVATVVDGRKTATLDPNDYTASYSYTRDHQVSVVFDAAGFTTSFGYDRDGLQTTVTDPNGSVSTTVYDPRGKVIETRMPHALVNGQPKETITRFEYDQVGNQTKVITPRGVETTDDSKDFLTEFRYDKLNRQIEQVYPFDKDDSEASYRNPQSVIYAYDTASRLTSVALPPPDPVHSVDPNHLGRIVSTFDYFDNGWIKKSTDPHGVATGYDYNELGLQTQRTVTAANGTPQRALEWGYFPDGKLRHHATTNVSTTPPFPEVRAFDFTYDPNGNLKTISDNALNPQSDRWELGYDQRNQVETITEKLLGDVKNTTTYGYNENGAPIRLVHNAAVAEYGYDERDLLSFVRNATSSGDPDSRWTRFTYTPRGERATETKSNGNVATYDYFLDGLLKHSVEKKSDDTLISEHTLEYQTNLNKSRDQFKLQSGGNSSIYLEDVKSYFYNPRDRVSRVEDQNDPTQGERYLYDANSNVIAQTIGDSGADTVQFFYDWNRLIHSGNPPVYGDSTYHYDDSGRVRSVTGGDKEVEQYFYDDFDHIVAHKQLGGDDVMRETRYAYDPLGRTSATTDHTGKTTTYAYLGLTGEVLDEQVGGATTRSFEYSAWNERLSQARLGNDPDRSVYGYNADGDVETLTKEDGNARATHGYSAYGVALGNLTTGKDKIDPQNPYKEPYNPYWFKARRFDQIAANPTGAQGFQPASYHLGARDYQPASHRFLSPDSRGDGRADLGLSLNPTTSNRYGFAGGTPASNVGYTPPFDWKRELTSLAVGTAVTLAITALAGPVCGATAGLGCVAAFWVAGGAAGAAASYGVNVAMDPNHSFNVGEFALNTAIGAGVGLVSFGFAKGVGAGVRTRRLPSCNSFAPGTPVLMADGSRKPIEDVKVGDKVLANNPKTGHAQAQRVTAVIVGIGEKQMVEVTVDTDGDSGSATGTVVATDEHPFWVANLRDWRYAKDLRPGDLLRTSAGTYVQVVKTRGWTAHQRVHNLTVDTDHTYYVGASTSSVLVHNASPCDLYNRARELYATRTFRKSTVAVAEVRNKQTGETELWVATEQTKRPREWDPDRNGTDPLAGETYKEGKGHAETTILDNLADQYEIVSIASSSNMCYPCLNRLKDAGLTPIGTRRRSTSGYSPWRQMVRTNPILSG